MKLGAVMDRILVAIFRLSAVVLHVLVLSPSIGALNCYECHSETSCKSPEQTQCDSDFNACVLQTTWKGNLFMEMSMARYCGYATECPRISADKTPFCNQTEDVLTCTMCCNDGDYCNNGGQGELLRPPPYPPVPGPLVKRLAENECASEEGVNVGEGSSSSCSTSISWTEESTVVNIVAVCGDTTAPDVPYTLAGAESSCTNNNQLDTGFCVTCCLNGTCPVSKATTSQSAVPILVLACSLVRWLVGS